MVFYLTGISFPNGGMASGNRARHLSRALVEAGIPVRVLTPFSDSGRCEQLMLDGIVYESLCDMSTNRFIRHLAVWFVYPYRLLKRMYAAQRHSKIVIYSYTAAVEMMTIHWILSLLLRCPLAAEECEYPFSVLTHASRVRQWYESRIVPHFYNGIVCISHALQEYFQPRVRKSCRSIYVPMTVDCDPFIAARGKTMLNFDYIAYTGSMWREGGGVDVLVKSFSLVATKHAELHLVLIGDGNDELRREFEAMAGDCANRIHCIFGGKVPRDEMPRYIANAKLLAMLPLPTFQQQGCFPTKLGEYLSSGVPTVITKVGNPVRYLTDNENIFYVPPNDEQATADKFEEILGDYSKAQTIGKNGQQFAREHFHYANFAKPLSNWYHQLVGVDK